MAQDSDGRAASGQAAASAPAAAHVPVAVERTPGMGTGRGGGGSSGGGGGPTDGAPAAPASRRTAWLLAAAVAVAVGVGGFMMLRGKDSVSPQEQQQRLQEFAAAGSIRTERVPQADVGRALESLPMAAADKARLQSQLDAGSARLVYITLWDNVAEDDDRVRIDSGTFSFEVKLMNRPTRIAVPQPPSGTLNVVGTRDGGGGITVAMMSGTTTVRLPVMAVGQALGVPVVLAP